MGGSVSCPDRVEPISQIAAIFTGYSSSRHIHGHITPGCFFSSLPFRTCWSALFPNLKACWQGHTENTGDVLLFEPGVWRKVGTSSDMKDTMGRAGPIKMFVFTHWISSFENLFVPVCFLLLRQTVSPKVWGKKGLFQITLSGQSRNLRQEPEKEVLPTGLPSDLFC